MKKTDFLKMKFNGQIILLMTNLFLLVIILTNFSFARNADNNDALEVTTALENNHLKVTNNAITKSKSSATVTEPFIGEIGIFAGNFAPRDWMFCDGQLLAIRGNEALFSILGTTYGGDGRTRFALPDLRGRVPIHAGQGPKLDNVTIGQKSEQAYMMPYFDDKYKPVLPPATQAVRYIIAVRGLFPSRN